MPQTTKRTRAKINPLNHLKIDIENQQEQEVVISLQQDVQEEIEVTTTDSDFGLILSVLETALKCEEGLYLKNSTVGDSLLTVSELREVWHAVLGDT